MPIEYTISDVAEDAERDLWQVTYQSKAGEARNHLFPKATLEWRAAEYGLDDVDEILDIILHEPYAPAEQPVTPMSLIDAPARTALRPTPRITLYTAESTAQARDAHRQLIADVKANHVQIAPPKGADPLDHIRRRHGITPDGLRAKSEQVDTHRWKTLYGGLPVPVEEASNA
ncbi:hypothetical protein [Streptomyces sp. ME19-01-6]|uniref:hypothetical protein n=1 Tax=Streptomyces sp. ME19-01-6 TaxID=3028686 RepID=UPI0029A5407A|nr:hypothetical protein [Streptomyces sp. ME19-01-6]MDX3230637.1 hypothetical protein [Streptomyces sp. ME19-01-6]